MPVIDLNCDLGEGFPSDALLMPFISSANIACGGHAGDDATMQHTVQLCLQHNVAIGAHPSYPDRAQFGRQDLLGRSVTYEQLPDMLAQQIHALAAVCALLGTRLHHVKPHGALYNRAAQDAVAAGEVCRAIQAIDPALILYGQSGSEMECAAAAHGLPFVPEVFADRTYENNGLLRARSFPDALITDTDQCVRQVLQMVLEQQVTTISGGRITMRAGTVCLHGDGAHAVAFAKAIHTQLTHKGIIIAHES